MDRNVFFIVAAAALATGPACVILPTATTHEVSVRVEESAPTTWGAVGWDIAMEVHPETASVVVTAARLQECSRLRTEIYDAVTTKTTRVAWLLGDAPVQSLSDLLAIPVATLLFLPVTAVTGIVSGGVVAASHPKTARLTRPIEAYEGTCRAPVTSTPVALTLPSGAELTAQTGSDGRSTFAIPESESYAGTAAVRIADQTRTVAFVRTAPLPYALDREMIVAAISRVKPRVASCHAGSPAKGIVKLHLKVGGDGRVGSVAVERAPDAQLGACVASAVQTATFDKTQRGGSFSYPFLF